MHECHVQEKQKKRKHAATAFPMHGRSGLRSGLVISPVVMAASMVSMQAPGGKQVKHCKGHSQVQATSGMMVILWVKYGG